VVLRLALLVSLVSFVSSASRARSVGLAKSVFARDRLYTRGTPVGEHGMARHKGIEVDVQFTRKAQYAAPLLCRFADPHHGVITGCIRKIPIRKNASATVKKTGENSWESIHYCSGVVERGFIGRMPAGTGLIRATFWRASGQSASSPASPRAVRWEVSGRASTTASCPNSTLFIWCARVLASS